MNDDDPVLDPLARIAEALRSEHAKEERCAQLALYVAIGDSFTAGTGCDAGLAWPERLTRGLRRGSPSLELRNLAVEGATSDAVLGQLVEAVELEPDLVTVVCGANDVLLSTRPDPHRYARNLASIFRRLGHSIPGARIMTATSPERWDFLPLGPRTRDRVESGILRFNRATRGIARAYGVPCLDVAGHPGLSRRENFARDGLHPSALGHARAARGFAELLRDGHGISNQGGLL
jgi:lysophospholipase L1-like esterase